MKADTPALAPSRARGNRRCGSRRQPHGTCSTPTRARGRGGVVLTAAPDGSVLASGPNPGETVYTVEATTTVCRQSRRIRLEALPDPSLPKGGPGRDPYGNFADERHRDRGRWRRALAIKSIRADEAVGGTNLDAFFPKTLPRDVSAPRGWRIDASREDKRLPRQIVFTLDRPAAAHRARWRFG